MVMTDTDYPHLHAVDAHQHDAAVDLAAKALIASGAFNAMVGPGLVPSI